jgi:hypothetical protein
MPPVPGHLIMTHWNLLNMHPEEHLW